MDKKRQLLEALKPLELPLKNKEDLANIISDGSDNNDDFIINLGFTSRHAAAEPNEFINIDLINYCPLTIKKDGVYFNNTIINPLDCKIQLSDTSGNVWADTNIKWINTYDITPTSYEGGQTDLFAVIYNIMNLNTNKIIIPCVSSGGYADIDYDNSIIKLAPHEAFVSHINNMHISEAAIPEILEFLPNMLNLFDTNKIIWDAYSRGALFLIYDIETKEIGGYYLAAFNPFVG
jgi:hypothetical protein